MEKERGERERGEARLNRGGMGKSVADGRLDRYGGKRGPAKGKPAQTGRKGRSYRVDWK